MTDAPARASGLGSGDAIESVDAWPLLSPTRVAPHPLVRLAITLIVASGSAWLTFRWFSDAPLPPDFWFPHTAARALTAGRNPYQLALGSPEWPSRLPLFYPLTAVALVTPLARLPLATAGALFMAASGGGLAWWLTRFGAARALLFATGSYLTAVRLGQWSPLLCLAALFPGAAWLATAKPTIGLAMLATRPSWRALAIAGAFALATVILLPSWPLDWLRAVRSTSSAQLYLVPIATPWGWPALLALLRWRRPEARLLLALACVPQVPAFADQLALGLVARTRIEALAFSVVNLTAWLLWLQDLADWTAPSLTAAYPYVLAGTYLPALLLVLLTPARRTPPP